MLFQKKAYPNKFINKKITKFEDSNFNDTNDCNLANTKKMEKELQFTFGIPYIGKPANMFSKNLKAVIKTKLNVLHEYLL